MKMRTWRRRENNRKWEVEEGKNVVVVVYSFTFYQAVLKKKVESRVDVGWMWNRRRVDRRSMYLWMEKYIE